MKQTNLHYFNAGTFLKNDNYNGNKFGLSLFIKTIESNPDDYYAWLKSGEWIVQLVQNNKEYYHFGVSCLKKAFSLNPESKKESYSYNNNLISDDIWKNQPIASIETFEKFKIDINLELIISEYNKTFYPGNINIEGRIDLIKELSESRDILFFDFLKFIIQNEDIFEIRITALKRIIYYKKFINLENFFNELSQKQKIENEPFYSLSLYYINENWSKELLNKNIIDNILESAIDSQSELDDELNKLFEEISHSFDGRHFFHFIESKRYDRLYRAIKLSDTRIYKLQARNILDISEELTDFGISCLEKYIGLK